MREVAIPGYADRVSNYVAALQGVGLEPVVTLEKERAASCAGLLLPGGGDMDPARFGQENAGSRDMDEFLVQIRFDMLDAFARAGKPVLGICQGHQVINVYFGGDLIQDLPTAQSHMAHGHEDSVHGVAIRPESLLGRMYGARASVNSSHHQGAGRLGRGLSATAFAPDGVVEAVEHGSLPILGVQFHPERMAFAHARPDTADGRLVFDWLREQL